MPTTVKSSEPEIKSKPRAATTPFTVDAGDDNDTIRNSAKGVSIHAGDGNDVVSLYAHTSIEDWANSIARALSPLTNDIVSYVLGFDVSGTLDNVKILTDSTKTFDDKKDALNDIKSTII